MPITSGVPTICDYLKLRESDCFLKLEKFSDQFIQQYQSIFSNYRKKWVLDSFHQWSRQWEYPYVFEQINHFMTQQNISAPAILDAGCGLTFFPCFLATHFPKAKITCSDFDHELITPFAKISEQYPAIVFSQQDMHSMSFADQSYDLIYCVSVLEHTQNYLQILQEFKRLLKPQGMLILTFDVSLNNCADIPVKEAESLLGSIYDMFMPDFRITKGSLLSQINHADILTTHYFQKENPQLLPWKYPRLSLIKSAFKRKCLPQGHIKYLTVCCQSVYKK
jgi:2-polyprenyl-3-methyl-5-hydroxy-6-metoxy-1,4-benzoquinol methylase